MAARSFLSAYVLVAILHAAAVGLGQTDAADLTMPLLVPLLIGWLISETGRSWPTTLRWLLAALVLSWIVDLLPQGSAGDPTVPTLTIVVIVQAVLVQAFRAVRGPGFRRGIVQPGPARGLVRRHRLLALPFAAAATAAGVAIWSTGTDLRLLLIVCAVAATVASVAALDLVGRMPAAPAWLTWAGTLAACGGIALVLLTSSGAWTRSTGTEAATALTHAIALGLISVGLVTGLQAVERAQQLLDRRSESPDQVTR